MHHFRVGATAAGVVWMLIMCGALFWHLAPSPNFLGVPTSASASAQGHSAGSLGDNRHLMLLEATRLFKEGSAYVPQGVLSGAEFAPVIFLNSHLKDQGVKWRVRSTNGLDADIYEIS